MGNEAGYYDPRPPHPCERLARLEGQSNYLSLLAGIEAAPDTTEDAAALAMARRSWAPPPEMLEAYWGHSVLYRRAICAGVFDLIDKQGSGIAKKDRVWVKAAILDAFARFIGDIAPPSRVRAKRFKARYEDYLATRKFAEGLMRNLKDEVEWRWVRARFGNS